MDMKIISLIRRRDRFRNLLTTYLCGICGEAVTVSKKKVQIKPQRLPRCAMYFIASLSWWLLQCRSLRSIFSSRYARVKTKRAYISRCGPKFLCGPDSLRDFSAGQIKTNNFSTRCKRLVRL